MATARPPCAPLVAPGELDHHVADMTATASGQMTLDALQRRLAEHDQWLPIDGDPLGPLGRLIETNSTGPLRLGYGAWRDLLLGVQLENGLGELITAGGRTVKNVAGYDLTKFMVGQGGVFGRIVTLTMRTYRRPAAALLAEFAANTKLAAAVMTTDLRPQWMLLTPDALLMGYLADEAAADFYQANLPRLEPRSVQRRSLAEDAAHRARLWQAGGEMSFRAAVPPARLEQFVSAIAPIAWVADAAFGIVLGGCDRGQCDRVRAAAAAAGGSVVLRRADGTAIGPPRDNAEKALLERLKDAFDPDRRLAPLPWDVT